MWILARESGHLQPCRQSRDDNGIGFLGFGDVNHAADAVISVLLILMLPVDWVHDACKDCDACTGALMMVMLVRGRHKDTWS